MQNEEVGLNIQASSAFLSLNFPGSRLIRSAIASIKCSLASRVIVQLALLRAQWLLSTRSRQSCAQICVAITSFPNAFFRRGLIEKLRVVLSCSSRVAEQNVCSHYPRHENFEAHWQCY